MATVNLRKFLTNAATTLASVFVVTLLADRGLMLLGFPSEYPAKVTHPPNYSRKVENIEFDFTFVTNSQGLRSPEIPLKKERNEYRILVAGDSFIQGIGMDMEQTIPAFLEQRLEYAGKTVRVINGGLAGTGPVAYGKLIFHLLEIYDIDAVLIGLFANDVTDTSEKANPQAIYPVTPQRWGLDGMVHALWPRISILVQTAIRGADASKPSEPPTSDKGRSKMESVAQEAADRGIDRTAIDAWRVRVNAWLDTLTAQEREGVLRGEFGWNILAYGLSRPSAWAACIDIDTPSAEKRWVAAAGVLAEIVKGLRARGKEVGLIYIPSKFQYEPLSHSPLNAWKVGGAEIRPEWLDGELEIDRRLAEFANRTEVPLLNLTPGLRRAVADGAVPNWKHDEHLNSEGNRFVADAIATWLMDRRVFSGLK